ncbi:MAG: ArnT family glycosyltransferase [Gammaproteobacteria bacterium]
MTLNPNRDPVALAAPRDTVGVHLTRPWHWRGAVAALLILAGYVAGIGTRAIPLDGHEVFVVQTAQEMSTRGDFIVPYFNGEPRLTKPPLSYWLTWLVASITGDPRHIAPWQGRLPSIAAGIGLVATALWLGTLLFDRATGLFAGLLLTLSAGFFSYTHDARPDLLYAFWCALGYTAFAAAWKAADYSRQLLGCYAMWVAYALAILTKGPQLPAILLAGNIVFLALAGGFRRGLGMLHPVTGLLLTASLTLPWWFAVHASLGGTGLSGSQLLGSLLTPSVALDFYYFYRTPLLLLPWLLLIPFAFVLFRKRERSDGSLMLWLWVLVAALLLDFGPQQRWFYMLPLLPALCILTAAGTLAVLRRNGSWIHAAWRWIFLPLHALLALCALLWIAVSNKGAGYGNTAGIAAAAGALAVVLCAVLILRRGRPVTPLGDFVALGVMYGIALAAVSDTRWLWSQDRFERPRLARIARAASHPATPIVSWGINPNGFVYYVGGRITALARPGDFNRFLAGKRYGELIVLMLKRDLNRLPENIDREVLAAMPGDADEATVVARLRGDALARSPRFHVDDP